MQTHVIDQDTAIYQTNCWYTNEGQIIAVKRSSEDHGVFHFFDVSRGITGAVTISTNRGVNDSVADWVHTIHKQYLNNDYEQGLHWKNRQALQAIANTHRHEVPVKR